MKRVPLKNVVLASVSVLALSSAAFAADVATKAPTYQAAPLAVNWTGSYFGIQGGFVRQDGSLHDFDEALEQGTLIPGNSNKLGGTVGGVLGYDWQLGSLVYGLEGDWNWLGGRMASNGFFLQTSFGADWLATTRGRVGLASDATLIYFTGGLALGHVRDSVALFNVVSFSEDARKVGWTVGAGIEQKLSANWSAKAEFRYVDLGSSTVSCIGDNACSIHQGEFDNTLMMGLVGVNYKF